MYHLITGLLLKRLDKFKRQLTIFNPKYKIRHFKLFNVIQMHFQWNNDVNDLGEPHQTFCNFSEKMLFKKLVLYNRIIALNLVPFTLKKAFPMSPFIPVTLGGRYHCPHFIDKTLRHKEMQCFTQGHGLVGSSLENN